MELKQVDVDVDVDVDAGTEGLDAGGWNSDKFVQ